MAHRDIERVEARYEVREVPFATVYEWHPAYVALECDCGEQLIPTTTSTTIACSCGTRLGGFVNDIRERVGRLQDSLAPWFHDTRALADQHLRDEASYPEGSPWRYDDVTADNG